MAEDLKIEHFFGGGVYARKMVMDSGDCVATHEHHYDHLSILAVGKVQLVTDGKIQEFEAPACIMIKANTKHKIHAIRPTVWYCIHATEETDESKIDEVLIK